MEHVKPLISIITVVYNGEDSIEETILSVLNQTFKNYEYIVIDGKSSDATTHIIKKYNNKISFWISEPDRGIYDAMNKGISCAKGEWLYFLNSKDSFCSNTALQDIAYYLSKSKFSLVVGSVVVTKEGVQIDEFPKLANIDHDNARALFNSHFCHQAVFIKKTSYLKFNSFNLKLKIFADFDLMGRIIQSEKGFYQIPVKIALFDSNGYSSNWHNIFNIIKEREQILDDLGFSLNMITNKLIYLKAFMFFWRKKIFTTFLK